MLLRFICGLNLKKVSCDTTNFHNTTVSHNNTTISHNNTKVSHNNTKVSRNNTKNMNNNCFKIINNLPNLLTFFRKSKKKRITQRITPVKNRVYMH